MIDTVADTGAAGQRFTHWTLFEMVNRPLFSYPWRDFQGCNLVAIVLFISILYAVYRYSTEQRARAVLWSGRCKAPGDSAGADSRHTAIA